MTDDEFSNWQQIMCVLEVDMQYPKKLPDPHNEYPLMLQRLTVNKVEKLIPNLHSKKNCVLHRENLKLYIKNGLKFHRGIKFNESPWLQKYIQLNTDLQMKGKTDFENNFFKLMNTVFGKTMGSPFLTN
jgi:hypothetical protein